MKLLEVNIHRLLVQREQWMRGKADRGISESGVEEVEVSEVKSGDMENGEEKTLYDTEESFAGTTIKCVGSQPLQVIQGNKKN